MLGRSLVGQISSNDGLNPPVSGGTVPSDQGQGRGSIREGKTCSAVDIDRALQKWRGAWVAGAAHHGKYV